MSDKQHESPSDSSNSSQRLRELASVFLKLGMIAFGGPAAHIAMMDNEVVNRRQWMSREKLLDLLGITNLIPGPNSTELAIHIGYERAGWRGLMVAGICFILPAMLIVWALAALYVRYQTLPQMAWLLYGIKPVIIAVVLQAVWKLGQKAAKDTATIIAGIAATVGFFAGISEIILLLVSGIAVMFVRLSRSGKSNITGAFLLPLLAQAGTIGTGVSTAGAAVSWGSVFLVFLKANSNLKCTTSKSSSDKGS